ncbi:hypothetical protein [Winslowiella iniecta]|uniref:hypothetical protein n=1 Tax=Winslowiella iniecta TaxID=1560201 RepID=UPI000A6801AF|nr:hypothetical protein [Winslowiella iniecta]
MKHSPKQSAEILNLHARTIEVDGSENPIILNFWAESLSFSPASSEDNSDDAPER